MNIQSQKSEARKAAFARRKQAFENIQYDLSEAVLAQTGAHEIIASYMPMRTEINPLKAMHDLVVAGKRVCVPIIQGQGQALEFHEWTPDCELIEGEFGAFIPKNTACLIPDFVLAPMVAFDNAGTRLGYGGGFYDRTLEKLRGQKPTPYIGLAFEAQLSSKPLPKEATDIALDGIITENGFRKF